MRKITGYIGALIIVFALAGSVLAGFVLNITNDEITKDNYEIVTDISGLYSHSQEKTYIEYNPAKNYIGFNREQNSFTINNYSTTIDNRLTYGLYHGAFTDFDFVEWDTTFTGGNVFTLVNDGNGGYDGVMVHYSNSSNFSNFQAYHIFFGETFTIYIWGPTGDTTAARLVYWDNNGNTYSRNLNSTFELEYSNSTINVYYNGGISDTFACGWVATPVNNGPYAFVNGNTRGYDTTNNIYHVLNTGTPFAVTKLSSYNGQTIYGDLYESYHPSSNGGALVPTVINYIDPPGMGINYTASNRVNNYPVISEYDSVTQHTYNLTSGLIQTDSDIDYISLGLDYATDYDSGGVHYTQYYAFMTPYKTTLATIINNLNLDVDTTYITFNNNSDTYITTPAHRTLSTPTPGFVDKNAVWFVNPDTQTATYGYNFGIYLNGQTTLSQSSKYFNSSNYKQSLVYDLNRGLVDFYINDVKVGTYSPQDITVLYGGQQSSINYRGPGGTEFIDVTNTTFQPTITTTLYYTEYATHPPVYMDPTKGISIQDNTVTTWSNGYENSDIQILFRIDETGRSYENTITVGQDSIKISSDGTRFYVKINNGSTVDIGNWRNVVIDLNVLNGTVSAYPVKTFNNYTNVILYDGAEIYIGQLTNKDTVNSITFNQTDKSFWFLVYNTWVFMDTYGVVMVDPTLTITDYFTDLDGFYKVTMYNFALVGDSITINGNTYNIVNNKIEIDNSEQRINELEIIYKGGECWVYFGDSDTLISLGSVTDSTISMVGNWFFNSKLYKGSEITAYEYNWHIEDFIINNGQFVVIYLGLLAACYVVARKYCEISFIDHVILVVSIIISLGVPLIV